MLESGQVRPGPSPWHMGVPPHQGQAWHPRETWLSGASSIGSHLLLGFGSPKWHVMVCSGSCTCTWVS